MGLGRFAFRLQSRSDIGENALARFARPASLVERSVAAVLLLVLVGIGVLVLRMQADFPPDKYRANPAAGGTTLSRPNAVPLPVPDGATAMSAPETFDAQTLPDKINGRAELYLANGFVSLRCRRLTPADAPGDWVEACAYDMGTFPHAFAVFGTQRRRDAVVLPEAGPHAYRTSQALFVAHDRHYLEVIASSPSPAAMTLAQDFVQAFLRGHPANGAQVAEAALFPLEGARTDTLVLLGANAFGSPDLDRVFTMRYDVDGVEVTAFLSRRTDDAQALALANGWADTLLRYGAQARTPPADIPGSRAMDVLGLYETVFAVGPVLAGIHEAPDPGKADVVALRLYQALVASRSHDAAGAPEPAEDL